MSVTAKLSSKFYERLGDDIASELVDWFNAVDLTYQTQLREMNDLNWERFKATLLAESASIRGELGGEFHAGLAGLRTEMHGEFTKVREQLRDEAGGLRREIAAVHTEMTAMRADLIKWMFIFWATTALAVLSFALQ